MTFDIPFPGDLTGWCCWCEHWAQGRATRHSRERRGLMVTSAKGVAECTLQHCTVGPGSEVSGLIRC